MTLVLSLLQQVPASGQTPRLPVLDFPEPGLDDTDAYQGYQTRFYRDSEQNTLQIYLEPRSGRVVNLWANGSNESIGFTARDHRGRAAQMRWGGDTALVSREQITSVPGTEPKDGRSPHQRTFEYQLTSDVAHLQLGLFVLGSMRVERDFQYQKRHLRPFTAGSFPVAEESLLVATLRRLPGDLRASALDLLQAASLAELRSRLRPTINEPKADSTTTVRVFRESVDGRNHLRLDLRVDSADATARVLGNVVSIRSRNGRPVRFTVRLSTDAPCLTPLKREQIFNKEFLTFLDSARGARDSAGNQRYRRLERQVRAVELLSSKEKLMAGLPNYATYFGRDMMMSALMMQPVWTPGMSEHVIASVLRKLGPNGEVSHEEALGGQAIRENAVVYDSLITAYLRAARSERRPRAADSLLRASHGVLENLQRTRENYHMIDDEFQLPVLVARYLADSAVAPERKRAFLFDSSGGRGPRLALLLREMALVAGWIHPYVEDPRPTNLVSFPKRYPAGWRSASWRDSDAGYAGGRFAMDVNAIWAPHALQSFEVILAALDALGIRGRGLDSLVPGIDTTILGEFHRNPAMLRAAIEAWRGSRRHFQVALGPTEVKQRVHAKLAWLPPAERRYWDKIMARQIPSSDSVFFLALSLDSTGKPIPVVNTDPATGLFLDHGASAGPSAQTVARDLSTFVLPYPVGLLVDSLGPLVANDAYASREVWERFSKDTYHSPRVVWGREVNLLLLGLARQLGGGADSVAREVLRRTTAAVAASGLGHNELWGYRIDGGRLLPVRHAGMEMTTDIQLWNTTDLAVEFVLSRLAKIRSPVDHNQNSDSGD